MAIKLKQYLENSWYRGASQDRQTGYAAQFQYGENVNIRDMKNGVCLSGGATDLNQSFTYNFSFFTTGPYDLEGNMLHTVDRKGVVRNINGTTEYDLNLTPGSVSVPQGVLFKDDIYIVHDKGVHKIDNLGTITDITPTNRPLGVVSPCIMNYANTFLLVSAGNMLWKYDLDGNPAKLIRKFDSSYYITGLTQEGNYLKIYTSDGLNTKIHYAKGTFDVEYTGLVQTVSFKGLSLSTGGVASDQGQDYAIFQFAPGELKLAKISGYNKTDIRWTQTWDGQKIFTSSSVPYITASDGVVFAATDEGVWTFTEYNGWLWGGCVEFRESDKITCLFRYGEKLYACIKNGNNGYIMRHYDLSFHPATYQTDGFIIGRVFDGGCAGLFKKNDQATITYHMPLNTNMELSYRYDRETFGYSKSNFLSIKKLTDTNTCYDIVVPTTPSNTEESNLLKQDGDLILLENGNGIRLEDTLVCPFNKTWNLLEYRFDLSTTDVSKTPILFEHSLTYYDYMRKYR